MVFNNDEICIVEVNKSKLKEMYRYDRLIKGASRHLYNITPRN